MKTNLLTRRLHGVALLVLWTLIKPSFLRAATNAVTPGSLDLTFVTTNRFLYSTNNPYTFPVRSLAIDAEGYVYVAGDFTAFNGAAGPGLVRLFPDGTADRSFQPPWSAGWFGSMVTVQPDQKLLVLGGTVGATLNRLNRDGSLDWTFQNAYWRGGFLLQPDGRILLVSSGWLTATVLRLHADGTQDWSFTPLSFTFGQDQIMGDYALQPNGGLLLRVGDFRRYYSDGSRDNSFHPATSPGRLCVRSDSRILVGREGLDLCQLNPDGTLDNTFSRTNFPGLPMQMAVQPDGRVLAACFQLMPTPSGIVVNVDIHRVETNGTPDHSFLATVSLSLGPLGPAWNTALTSMLVQPDGQILIGGTFSTVNGTPVSLLARLNGEHVPVLRVLGRPGPAGFPIELTGGPAKRYAVGVSSNLISWWPAGYVTNSASGACEFLDQTAPGLPQRFYRARRTE